MTDSAAPPHTTVPPADCVERTFSPEGGHGGLVSAADLDLITVTERVTIFRTPWLLPTHREIHRNNLADLVNFLTLGSREKQVFDVSGNAVLREYAKEFGEQIICFQ